MDYKLQWMLCPKAIGMNNHKPNNENSYPEIGKELILLICSGDGQLLCWNHGRYD